ncbi:hypothetical protein SCP_0203190 [Sparassis crispa]|uniref:HRQ family protein n=1 Tax=Sparassis crispa TaxID=139825 RepID=A0A401GAC5_9APHY|nr:hypothetical protein SCP_0203190 [Sparassis crispa]GBE79122.1 hypothetical protein SCP_0203190 [Sparassis crispa]
MTFADPQMGNILAICFLLVAAAVVAYLTRVTRKVSQVNIKVKGCGDSEKTEREAGEWTPVVFDYPKIEPFTGDLSAVKPIPYRPFRWGDYHVTMGIRNMPWNEWIELDQQFFDYHKIREYRLRTRADRSVIIHPEQPGIVQSGHAGAEEFLYELAEYLPRRYPTIYRVERHATSKPNSYSWYGENPIKSITIIPLQITYDLDEEDPLTMAARLVQEDFAIMIEGTDGRYYLQGGAILIPGFWRLKDKVGMPLDQIHVSGDVPQYQSKLHLSMGRFFRRLPVDKPVIRNNYGFQVVKNTDPTATTEDPTRAVDPTELAWSASMQGNEDRTDYERSAHVRTEHADGKVRSWTELLPSMVHLRTERQTLRRLPRTGAVVFTIRVYQTPIDSLAQEPGAPGRLASAIRSWPDDVADYKDRFAYEDILQYLDKRHAEQIEAGEITGEERISYYPF